MSDRLQPGAEAKARIQALSEPDLLAFFDELPVAAMQRVARHLPKIDGFRPTSSLGIARQKSALARKLSGASASDRDYNGLYLIWREWVYATFKNSSTVQELIDQVEEAVDGAQDEETKRLAIGNKVDALFAKLNEDSRQDLCTREQIERFLTFSPLPETTTARSMIAGSKATSDVEHDTKLNELPERYNASKAKSRIPRRSLGRLQSALIRVCALSPKRCPTSGSYAQQTSSSSRISTAYARTDNNGRQNKAI